MDTRPIGVLDSGVGGLTVLKGIFHGLPCESTYYLGDSLRAPYGKRSAEEILLLAKKLIAFLLKKDVKLIVIACNTITVNGIDKLRLLFPQVPIIGTVPVVKTAVQITKNKKIGLLVTGATALSAYNTRLIEAFASHASVTIVGTNKLVPLIEAGNFSALKKIIKEELQPFLEEDVDTVILGSTHFPIMQDAIQSFLGKQVMLLHSSGAVARQVKRVLENNNALSQGKNPVHTFFTTGSADAFTILVKKVIGQKNPAINHIVLQ